MAAIDLAYKDIEWFVHNIDTEFNKLIFHNTTVRNCQYVVRHHRLSKEDALKLMVVSLCKVEEELKAKELKKAMEKEVS